ncbi:MAG: septum formation protein Maf [Gammaproteobacteria bacterium]|nr:septum formation protein Maf [Gammaproteobacteria bacterium]
MTNKVILASASPRRAQLLEQIGINFEVLPQTIDETPQIGESAPDLALRLAHEKAQSALECTDKPNPLALGSDTVVVIDDTLLGKPISGIDAVRMLTQLSGRVHRVCTAVSLASRDSFAARLSETKVQFRQIPESEALAYWNTGEPIGKAGGYAIQGFGAAFVESISGSYSGVMGLPLFETSALLVEFGVPVWKSSAAIDKLVT